MSVVWPVVLAVFRLLALVVLVEVERFLALPDRRSVMAVAAEPAASLAIPMWVEPEAVELRRRPGSSLVVQLAATIKQTASTHRAQQMESKMVVTSIAVMAEVAPTVRVQVELVALVWFMCAMPPCRP